MTTEYAENYDAIDWEQEYMLAKLVELGQVLVAKRKEAVDFKANSGLEEILREDIEYYEGTDKYTRASRFSKPRTGEGRVTEAGREVRDATEASVFVNITEQYVDMAAASISDMVLPTDDKPFDLDPTPIADLDEFAESDEIQRFPDGTEAPAKDVVKMIQEKASKIAERSETRIWDWLVEFGWHAEGRKLIHSAAKTGTGVLEGPIPSKKKKKRVEREDGLIAIKMDSETKPESKCVKVENLYPDPACGENIHNGSYLFKADSISRKQLIELKEQKGYIKDQIDRCLKELKDGTTQSDPMKVKIKNTFDIWFYHGAITPDDMRAAGCECGEDAEEVPATVTMVGDYVIKAAKPVLDSGEFPFDVLQWEPRDGSWMGKGVARQVRVPQDIVNAGWRTRLQNGGLSSGAMSFFSRVGIQPVDGVWELTPNKQFWVDPSQFEGRRVDDALHFELIPNLQEQFKAIIDDGMELAERLTSFPMILQGQQGAATKTVGGMHQLQLNANSTRRRIAKAIDDRIFKPHIGRYYDYLIVYGDDDDEKGDAQIKVKASSVFYERDARDQAIMELAPLARDPESEISYPKWVNEVMRANKIDPTKLKLTDEEQELEDRKMSAQQQDEQASGANQAETATIRAQVDLERAKITQETEVAKIQHQKEEAALDRAHESQMKQIDLQIRTAEISEKSRAEIEKLKTKLTDTSMKLTVQTRLSEKALAAKAASEHATAKTEVGKAPTEPVLRAPNTQAHEF